MASEGKEKLSLVKKQVEKMFKTIQKLENDEKTEAVGYLRKYLDGNNKIIENVKKKLKNSNETNDVTKRDQQWKQAGASQVRRNKLKNHTETLKKAVLKCRTCGALSKTKKLLLKHLEVHMGTPISCGDCKRSFNSRTAYKCHLTLKMCTKRGTAKYTCDQCPKVFRYKRHIERHLEGHKRNNCTYCDEKLTRRKNLVEHLQTVHSIKLERAVLFKCEHCDKRYVKKRSLYHHLKQHANDKVVCMECGHISETQEGHNEHYIEHDKDRPWKCDICNDRFSRQQQYLVHIKRHDRYKCVTCNESFASTAKVLRHKQRGHTVQGLEPKMKCPYCPNAFQRRLSLQIHIRKHTDDKPMYCKYCDKSFRSPYLYFKHCASTVHEINSPEKQQLVCEICGKLFMKKYQLEQHLQRVHNHTKQPYNCKFCGHKTTNRKNLDRHMSLHLEVKKECVCEQCGKAFYNLTTLKDHMSYVHSQERHFKCNQCDKSFKRNSELVRHKTSHSEVRPHVCQTCGLAYKRSTHLRRHEESQHGKTLKNRRVQRLHKDETGALIPIQEEKKTKPKSTKKATKNDQSSKQVFSIMDAQSGEMVTFAIPQAAESCSNSLATVLSINNQPYTQDIMQSVQLPYSEIWTEKMVAKPMVINSENMLLTNNISNQTLNMVNSNYSNHLLNDEFSGDQQVTNPFIQANILQEALPLESTTTCDILLPENRILEPTQGSGSYAQNPYQYL